MFRAYVEKVKKENEKMRLEAEEAKRSQREGLKQQIQRILDSQEEEREKAKKAEDIVESLKATIREPKQKLIPIDNGYSNKFKIS